MLNNKKQIFGWAMYDWANSAYVTTVATSVLPIYFASVVMPETGLKLGGITYSATTLWGFAVSFSAFVVLLIAPVIGAVADFSASKKRFLMTFCYLGSLATCCLFFFGAGDVWPILICFVIAQIGFISANIFYDAFLPHIATEDQMDRVSGQGFAYGYVGGGLQFAFSLGLIAVHESLGISSELAAKLAILTAGLWWAGFAWVTFTHLQETPSVEPLPAEYQHLPKGLAYLRVGVVRNWVVLRKVRLFRPVLLFLIAYMIYSNGIQTMIAMSTIYGAEELGFSTNVLMVTFLMIQFVSVVGALIFSRLAEIFSTKHALIFSLLGWSGVVLYVYFLTTPREYFILGGIVGLVLGGSQALSRSFYGSMIPKQAAAEFYGFYSVFNKGSAIIGPLLFALIRQLTGTAQTAILSVVAFFIMGLVLLVLVDQKAAKAATQDI
ncbi:MAG: MFS transporter [Microcoleaceae cyanobacterium]